MRQRLTWPRPRGWASTPSAGTRLITAFRFPLVQARWGSLAIIADAFKRNGLTLTPGSPGVSVDKYYKRSSKDGWDPPPIYARHAHWKKREVHSKEPDAGSARQLSLGFLPELKKQPRVVQSLRDASSVGWEHISCSVRSRSGSLHAITDRGCVPFTFPNRSLAERWIAQSH